MSEPDLKSSPNSSSNASSNKSAKLKKGLWFIGLWLAGVLTLATIGFIIRYILG